MAAKPSGNKSVLVIGLGRFGGSVAATLDQMGQDVLAVDKNPELVARWSAHLPTIQADMTDVLAIEQIDASQFDTAVVAIGDSIEASVIITGNLLDAGVSDLWAKSVSQEHARILQRIGARHIINAETDAGKRVGHLVAGNYLDYIEIDGPYTVVKAHTPLYAVGRSIEDVQAQGEALLSPTDSLFRQYPAYHIAGERDHRRCLCGNPLAAEGLQPGLYRVYSPDGAFLCLSRWEAGVLTSEKNFFGA